MRGMIGSSSDGTGYRPEIDGLRCLAVLSVILYHARIPPFAGGYVGVDIFFVISGFLITSIVLGSIAENSFTFVGFYERRVRRIMPALVLVSATTFAAALWVLPPPQLQDLGKSTVATMGLAANIHFFGNSGYFAPTADTQPLIHMWSLAVEEQFYLVFPALLFILHRIWSKGLPAALLLAFLVSLALCVAKVESYPTFTFYLPFTRAWELIAGALVASCGGVAERIRHKPRLRLAIEVTAMAAVVMPIFAYSRATPFPGLYALPPVLGTAAMLAVTTARSGVGRLLSARALVAVGLLSYSAYLWHQPLLALSRELHGTRLSERLAFGVIIVTFVLSWLSWRFVEQPFRRRSLMPRRALFALAAAASLLLAALGLGAHASGGWPGRFPDETSRIASALAVSPLRSACNREASSVHDDCRYFGARSRWAVVGDSHGIELAYALAERLRPAGAGVLHLTYSGCPPALLFDVHAVGCRAWLKQAVARLEREPGTTKVLLAYRHAFYLYGDHREAYPGVPHDRPTFLRELDPEQAREAYWRSFRELVRRLRSVGKQVYVMAPVPELPAPIRHYIYNHSGQDRGGGSLTYYQARQRQVLAALEEMKDIVLIRPAATMCDRLCKAVADGEALYLDDNHLSLAGARRIIARAPELQDQR
jgi:peptidoglycan/LPS O-acetylase OafA/YrhL